MDNRNANVSWKELQAEILLLQNNNVSNNTEKRPWQCANENCHSEVSLPLRTRFFVPIASPWFTAAMVSFLANKTVEPIAMGTLGWPSFFPEEQSSVLATEELQSVKYISRNTSIMNQTSEVAIITLQIWKLRRLMVPDCGERYILCNEMRQGSNYVQKNDILKRWWLWPNSERKNTKTCKDS